MVEKMHKKELMNGLEDGIFVEEENNSNNKRMKKFFVFRKN